MLDTATLTAFAGTTLVLLILPGPAVIYVMTRTLQLGLRRGLLGTLGVECGTLLHVAAAAVGLSTLVARSEIAYAVLTYAGSAYLLFLGVRQLRASADDSHEGLSAEPRARSAFWQGLVIEALNPKTALFFVALLPQFVNVETGKVWLQVGLLGAIFVGLAFLIDAGYAVFASQVRSKMSKRAKGRHLNRLSGVVHIGLAGLAATARSAG
jgi:threonine/homoserine/homoserine lactone efflux protein